MLDKGTVLKFYKRPEVQDAMIEHAKNKEVGMRYGSIFGKRPDVLSYPRDILELTLQSMKGDWTPDKAISFHTSEEIWDNPLAIHSDLKRKDLDELRIGWDLVLDIDCKIMEYSKICADLIIKFMTYCGVENISCKFSGNKGFHVALPFEAFPKQVGEELTKNLFPEAPRKIAFYIKENIKEELGRRIVAFERGDFSEVRKKVGLPQEEIIRYETNQLGDKVAKLNVDPFLEIDTVLLASRHLYRMPFSLHEKSGLVSLPVEASKVMEFEKPMALPSEVKEPFVPFLSRDVEESARRLLVQALDFKVVLEEERETKTYDEIEITSPITEDFFPDCMKRILQGLDDGKKRGLFCLMNFLGKVGWKKEEIEAYLYEWNKRNPEPLREVYIKGQLNSFKAGDKLPPNCNNDAYYKGLGISCAGDHCKRLKNPVNYTMSRWRRHLFSLKLAEKEGKSKEGKKQEEKQAEEKQ